MKGRSRKKLKTRPEKKIAVFLVLCLVCVNMFSTFSMAETAGATEYYAADAEEFMAAVSESEDGDCIIIEGIIEINGDVQIGDPSKNITVKRRDRDCYILLNSGMIEVDNMTFDGQGIQTQYPMISSYTDVVFNDCGFYDCGQTITGNSANLTGGAIEALSGSCIMNGCEFIGNKAVAGGAVSIPYDAYVIINDCVFTDNVARGRAGAINIGNTTGYCEINGGIISGNHADTGGGICNGGTLIVSGAKVYNNAVDWAGADIATKTTGQTILADGIEELNALFSDDGIEVYGWFNDWDPDSGIDGEFNPYQENSLLKLDYVYIEDEAEPETEPEPDDEDETDTDDPGDESDPDSEGEDDPETGDEDETESEPDDGTESESDADNEPESADEASEWPQMAGDDESIETPSDAVKQDSVDSDDPDGNIIETESDESSGNAADDPDENDNGSSKTDGNSSDASGYSGSSSGSNGSTYNDSSSERYYDIGQVDQGSYTTENYYYTMPGETETAAESGLTIQEVARPTGSTGSTGSNYYPAVSYVGTSLPYTGDESESIEASEDSEADEETEPESVDQMESIDAAIMNGLPNIRIDVKGVDCIIDLTDGNYDISISSGNDPDDVDPGEKFSVFSVNFLDVIQCLLLIGIIVCILLDHRKRDPER